MLTIRYSLILLFIVFALLFFIYQLKTEIDILRYNFSNYTTVNMFDKTINELKCGQKFCTLNKELRVKDDIKLFG